MVPKNKLKIKSKTKFKIFKINSSKYVKPTVKLFLKFNPVLNPKWRFLRKSKKKYKRKLFKDNKNSKTFRKAAEVKSKPCLRKSIQQFRSMKFSSSSRICKRGNWPNRCLKLCSVKKSTDNTFTWWLLSKLSICSQSCLKKNNFSNLTSFDRPHCFNSTGQESNLCTHTHAKAYFYW